MAAKAQAVAVAPLVASTDVGIQIAGTPTETLRSLLAQQNAD
eukprot:CAMPEP_0119107364 /NCGR_PEP_ID=MMETSP1180-20130426/9661_1 /TAXON_ID=3052 ORGANISM="Chlamydomonas cf sp, Strain CCMP681" /NCGR_SAMPLE_ID=MMETSP1180 /ASSEMBLY_ACC=CAM_ASM_000741 /LENGTH=41 /DNA_ID= /DNA_START= /DNA_END= /DNA_ORIENTATION=